MFATIFSLFSKKEGMVFQENPHLIAIFQVKMAYIVNAV